MILVSHRIIAELEPGCLLSEEFTRGFWAAKASSRVSLNAQMAAKVSEYFLNTYLLGPALEAKDIANNEPKFLPIQAQGPIIGTGR